MEPGGGVDGERFVGELTDVVLDFYTNVAVVVAGLLVGVVCGRWNEERVEVAEEALNSHFELIFIVSVTAVLFPSDPPVYNYNKVAYAIIKGTSAHYSSLPSTAGPSPSFHRATTNRKQGCGGDTG